MGHLTTIMREGRSYLGEDESWTFFDSWLHELMLLLDQAEALHSSNASSFLCSYYL